MRWLGPPRTHRGWLVLTGFTAWGTIGFASLIMGLVMPWWAVWAVELGWAWTAATYLDELADVAKRWVEGHQ